jgi:hypothetical protein
MNFGICILNLNFYDEIEKNLDLKMKFTYEMSSLEKIEDLEEKNKIFDEIFIGINYNG